MVVEANFKINGITTVFEGNFFFIPPTQPYPLDKFLCKLSYWHNCIHIGMVVLSQHSHCGSTVLISPACTVERS